MTDSGFFKQLAFRARYLQMSRPDGITISERVPVVVSSQTPAIRYLLSDIRYLVFLVLDVLHQTVAEGINLGSDKLITSCA